MENAPKPGDTMLIIELKRHMFANNLSIESVAYRLRCSAGHLNRIIKGKSPISERFEWKIANYLSLKGQINDHAVAEKDKK